MLHVRDEPDGGEDSAVRTVCAGWRDVNGHRVHEGIKVLQPENGTGGPDSHGICEPCRLAFLERADAARKEKASA